MPIDSDGGEAIVPEAARRRLTNQVARAYRGTYGARSGLCTLLRSASAQMIRSGSSPDAVARALVEHVRGCPAPTAGGALSTLERSIRVTSLIDLATECASDAAVEIARAGAIGAERRNRAQLHSSS